MRKAALAAILGLLSIRWLGLLPPWSWLAVLALALCALPYRSYPLSFVLFGLLWASISAHWAITDRLDPALDGRVVWLEGVVSGLAQRQGDRQSFLVTQARSRRGALPARLKLSWNQGPVVHSGERWRWAVKLRRPRGSVNPQGFDYEAWLTTQRIGALGSIKTGAKLSEPAQGSIRQQLRERLLQLNSWQQGATLAALVVGDGSALDERAWRTLQATGTVHLLVISGQQVMLLSLVIYGLVAALYRWGLWPARWPWLPIACSASLATSLAYGALTGFEVPVQRACWMLAVLLLWRLRYRHLPAWDAWLAALLGVLLIEPLASLQAGFWLSFAAVAWLIFAFSGRLGAGRHWALLWQVQWCVTLGLLPVLLALGLSQSLSAPLANLLAVPWVSVLCVPLALLGALLLPVPWLGEGLLWLAGASLHYLFVVLDFFAGILPAWQGQTPTAWSVLLAVLGVAGLLAPRGLPLRWPALLLLAPLLWPNANRPEKSQAQIWIFDVGQGLAVLVQTAQHQLLYDAGPRAPGFDSGARILLPSLQSLGVHGLDRLVLSHADSDHSGGAPSVLAAMPALRKISGEPQRLNLTDFAPCVFERWRWDGVVFELWPGPAAQGNGASCVLKVQAKGQTLLLTGDLDAAGERAWLVQHRAQQIDYLLAGHHGSLSSSSALFINQLQPAYALISRGAYNPFGHPHPVVLERFAKAGSRVLDTAREGALYWRLGSEQRPQSWRNDGAFWREK